MHNAVFDELRMDCIYLAFRVCLDEVEKALIGAKSLGISGLNVTIPLKERVMKLVKPDPLAKMIGAVNTIDLIQNIGYNTDGIGAKLALENEGVFIEGKNVLLLGAGGAARAITFQLREDGADVTIANRTERRAKELAEEVDGSWAGLNDLGALIEESDILINSTSIGMYPDMQRTLVTSDMMHPDLVVFDIVYNPAKTKLLTEAKKIGAKTIDGIMMLVHQGASSFKIWTEKEAPIDIMEKAVRDALG
jgi:shikimate dehydrogenase